MASETTSYVYLATNPEKSMFSLFIALDLPDGTGFEIAGPDSIGQVTIFEVKNILSQVLK